MSIRVVVPEGAVPGSTVPATTPDGNQLDLTVPEGVPPGSIMVLERDPATGAWGCTVEMAPSGSAASASAPATASRSISVLIPPGAAPGDPLNHVTEDGRHLDLTVPPGVPPGSYLNLEQDEGGRWICTGITEASEAATIEVLGDAITSVSLAIPEGMAPGSVLQHTTPDGRHLDLPIPDGVVPGMVMTLTLDPASRRWNCSIEAAEPQLPYGDSSPAASAYVGQGSSAAQASSQPPAEGTRMVIEVPAGAGPGTSLPLATPDGKTLDITVPDVVGPGSKLIFTQDPASGSWSCIAEPAEQSPKSGIDAIKQQRREDTRARGLADPLVKEDPVIRDASADMPPAMDLQRCDSDYCEEITCDSPPRTPQAALTNVRGKKVELPDVPNPVPTISGVEHLDAPLVFDLLQHSHCLLVDLRSDDRSAGLIEGAVHEPAIDSTNGVAFISKVPELIRRWAQEPLVVFTCQYSAHRAPQCANWYRDQANPQQRVAILTGGFRGWEAHGLPVKNAAATLAESQAADDAANRLGTQIVQEAGHLPGEVINIDDLVRAHHGRIRNDSASSGGEHDIRVLGERGSTPTHRKGTSDEVLSSGMPEINSPVEAPVLDKNTTERARSHSALWDGADTGMGPTAQSHSRQPRPPADQAVSSEDEDMMNDMDEGGRAATVATVPKAASAAQPSAPQQRAASTDTFGGFWTDISSRWGLSDMFGLNKKADSPPAKDKSKTAKKDGKPTKPSTAPELPLKPTAQVEAKSVDEPPQPIAPPPPAVSFAVGDKIGMMQTVKYKPYELQKGLTGQVLLINPDGHAWVKWDDGRQKWLRKDQFSEAVRIADPAPPSGSQQHPAAGSYQQPYSSPALGPGCAMRQSSYTPPPVSLVDGQPPNPNQSRSFTPAPQMYIGQAQPYGTGPVMPLGSGNSLPPPLGSVNSVSMPVDGGSMVLGTPNGSMVMMPPGASVQMAPGGGYPGASLSMAPAQGSSVSMAPAGGMTPQGSMMMGGVQRHDFGIGAASFQPVRAAAPNMMQHQQQFQQQQQQRPLDPRRIIKQGSQQSVEGQGEQKDLIGL